MKCAVLFSGGKDSCYAAWLVKKKSHELACLISIISENPESYMFHTPSIKRTKQQAKIMGIPLIIQKTKGKKEEELKDLKKAIKKAKHDFNIEAIVTGAIQSVYQKSRIENICDKLKLKCFNPLWKKDELEYWEELFENNFEIIITGVASEGLNEKWLGRKIDKIAFNELKELSKKHHFNLEFEGGEAESFVTNCPLFKKELKVKSYKDIKEGENSWRREVEIR